MVIKCDVAVPEPIRVTTLPNLRPATWQVRHRKCDVAVPEPIRVTTMLQCSAGERLAYNTVVGYAKVRDHGVMTA